MKQLRRVLVQMQTYRAGPLCDENSQWKIMHTFSRRGIGARMKCVSTSWAVFRFNAPSDSTPHQQPSDDGIEPSLLEAVRVVEVPRMCPPSYSYWKRQSTMMTLV